MGTRFGYSYDGSLDLRAKREYMSWLLNVGLLVLIFNVATILMTVELRLKWH